MLDKEKRRKITAVVAAILVIVLALGLTSYAFREVIFVYTAPKVYAFMKMKDFSEEIKDEMDYLEDKLIKNNMDYDDDLTFSFWKYTDSENEDKKGDLSFDLSISENKKRLEFAYDNTKAKKIKDMFLYVDNNEIGVNLADFSDDYWVNDGRYVISDYNNSSLRELMGKDKIKVNYNLSFDHIISDDVVDKVSKKEAFRVFLSGFTFEKREVISINKNEYKLYFSQTKKNTQDFLDVIIPNNWKDFFEVQDVNVCIHTKKGRVCEITVELSETHSFDISFLNEKKYLDDFALKFLINDKGNENEFLLLSKENRFEKGTFTDETIFSLTSSLGNKIYIKNSCELLNNDVKGECIWGINDDKTTFYYNGIFDTSDGILLDLENVKGFDSITQAGIYIENKFTNVIRKIENKKEILHMENNELINYVKKTKLLE